MSACVNCVTLARARNARRAQAPHAGQTINDVLEAYVPLRPQRASTSRHAANGLKSLARRFVLRS